MKGKTQRRQTLESSSLKPHCGKPLVPRSRRGGEGGNGGGGGSRLPTSTPGCSAKGQQRTHTYTLTPAPHGGPQGTPLPEQRHLRNPLTEYRTQRTIHRRVSNRQTRHGSPRGGFRCAKAHFRGRASPQPGPPPSGGSRKHLAQKRRRACRVPHRVGSRLAFGPGEGQQSAGKAVAEKLRKRRCRGAGPS